MASLEARILGEDRQDNYCSSDEGEHEEDRDHRPEKTSLEDPSSQQSRPWEGISQNTGPKGVLRDWELYQAHEKEASKAKEAELIKLVKKSSLSCRTVAEDEEEARQLEEQLMDDDILQEFVKKRMQSNLKQCEQLTRKFGEGLLDLSDGSGFLQVIDESDARVPVIIHIYDDKSECQKMNDCLDELSSMYKFVQFCKIRSDKIGLSINFKCKGVPAILVYKAGSLVGNYVQLTEELGQDFYPGDVENFLIENGIIEDRQNVPLVLKT